MSDSQTAPRPGDVSSPDAIISAIYSIISGPKGPRDWDRLRTLYLPGARLIPTGKRVHKAGELQVLTLEEWITDVEPFFAEDDFYELEIARRSDRFGNIIQAFSTYAARKTPDGPDIMRGINSIQLVFHRQRWWVISVMWDNEGAQNPIPAAYLPDEG